MSCVIAFLHVLNQPLFQATAMTCYDSTPIIFYGPIATDDSLIEQTGVEVYL